MYHYVNNAIAREKEIKAWTRASKEEIIEGFNPKWKFLNHLWCGEWPPREIWGDYYDALRNKPNTE